MAKTRKIYKIKALTINGETQNGVQSVSLFPKGNLVIDFLNGECLEFKGVVSTSSETHIIHITKCGKTIEEIFG